MTFSARFFTAFVCVALANAEKAGKTDRSWIGEKLGDSEANLTDSDIAEIYRNLTDERAQSNPRIVGGTNAALGLWPWQGLFYTNTGIICGCSLLSMRWAVTAAHCTHSLRASSINLRFGVINRQAVTSTAQTVGVETIIQHPSYEADTLRNDISLLLLDTDLDTNHYVQGISIPSQGSGVSTGTRCVITGWGTMEAGSSYNPFILQEATVPIVSNTLCQLWFSRFTSVVIYNDQLCAGYSSGGVDTCQGDSGGPLVCWDASAGQMVLQGITSYGFGCGDARRPGVYTRISEYSDWIVETTGSASSSRWRFTHLATVILFLLTAKFFASVLS